MGLIGDATPPLALKLRCRSSTSLPSLISLSFPARIALSNLYHYSKPTMADNSDNATTTSPEKATESQPSASSPPEAKPTETKRTSRADEADECPDEDETPLTTDLDSLTIDEKDKFENLDDPKDSHIRAVTTGDTPYTSAKTFEDLNLSPELLQGLYVEMRFQRPSKIQAISLPMILTPPYKNLIAQAHNGSGKTACFVLGMLSRVDPSRQVPQALCICPTRELARQNMDVLRKMGKFTGISSECAIPIENAGVPSAFRTMPPVTAQVVIGTPGTIQKWISRKLSLTSMKIIVFDEADHMLEEDGFKDDSLRIMKDVKKMSPHCQVLLFSATFGETVKNFVTRTVKDYNQMFVKKEELSLESVKQYKVKCSDELAKNLVIKDKILDLGEKVGQTIIFVRTRESARTLHLALVQYGYEVTTIQGALKQEDRDKIVKEFMDGLTQVLISTDVLARGFDQSQVNVVVNYDLPIKHETREPHYEVYLHRIGRAGRFGRKGAIFNLLCHDKDYELMEKIEHHFGIQVAEIQNDEKSFEEALRAAGLL